MEERKHSKKLINKDNRRNYSMHPDNVIFYDYFNNLKRKALGQGYSNLVISFKTIIGSILKYPLPITNSQDAFKLRGVGKSFSRYFEKVLSQPKDNSRLKKDNNESILFNEDSNQIINHVNKVINNTDKFLKQFNKDFYNIKTNEDNSDDTVIRNIKEIQNDHISQDDNNKSSKKKKQKKKTNNDNISKKDNQMLFNQDNLNYYNENVGQIENCSINSANKLKTSKSSPLSNNEDVNTNNEKIYKNKKTKKKNNELSDNEKNILTIINEHSHLYNNNAMSKEEINKEFLKCYKTSININFVLLNKLIKLELLEKLEETENNNNINFSNETNDKIIPNKKTIRSKCVKKVRITEKGKQILQMKNEEIIKKEEHINVNEKKNTFEFFNDKKSEISIHNETSKFSETNCDETFNSIENPTKTINEPKDQLIQNGKNNNFENNFEFIKNKQIDQNVLEQIMNVATEYSDKEINNIVKNEQFEENNKIGSLKKDDILEKNDSCEQNCPNTISSYRDDKICFDSNSIDETNINIYKNIKNYSENKSELIDDNKNNEQFNIEAKYSHDLENEHFESDSSYNFQLKLDKKKEGLYKKLNISLKDKLQNKTMQDNSIDCNHNNLDKNVQNKNYEINTNKLNNNSNAEYINCHSLFSEISDEDDNNNNNNNLDKNVQNKNYEINTNKLNNNSNAEYINCHSLFSEISDEDDNNNNNNNLDKNVQNKNYEINASKLNNNSNAEYINCHSLFSEMSDEDDNNNNQKYESSKNVQNCSNTERISSPYNNISTSNKYIKNINENAPLFERQNVIDIIDISDDEEYNIVNSCSSNYCKDKQNNNENEKKRKLAPNYDDNNNELGKSIENKESYFQKSEQRKKKQKVKNLKMDEDTKIKENNNEDENEKKENKKKNVGEKKNKKKKSKNDHTKSNADTENREEKENEENKNVRYGPYEIIMIIDNRDISGMSYEFNEKWKEIFKNNNIKYETRNLPLGDIIWLCRRPVYNNNKNMSSKRKRKKKEKEEKGNKIDINENSVDNWATNIGNKNIDFTYSYDKYTSALSGDCNEGCKNNEIEENVDYEEHVLKWIIERKALNDLSSSIIDGRYDEQKYRLMRSKEICHIIYLIEDSNNSFKNYTNTSKISYETLTNVQHSIRLINGFSILRSQSIKHTFLLLSEIHSEIVKNIKRICNVKNNEDIVHNEHIETYLKNNSSSWEIWNNESKKSKNNIVKETFGKQLRLINMCGADATELLLSLWPTPIKLNEALNKYTHNGILAEKLKRIYLKNRDMVGKRKVKSPVDANVSVKRKAKHAYAYMGKLPLLCC
ncbi:crossover junction endonuclease MUS81 [Plasmodium yoelii yoelii]|uniref:Crossover junction endonuclease MUS81 n=1 Tax=Plasmodium yoelii yoelii TaxID=73239 RepID=A0AAE9WT31_PLAYO|nr:crossover junction endonuclease MUS81 [Plasmodium yoelii yoelii]